MSTQEMNKLVEALRDGRIDELTPTEMDALENYLDAHPESAALLANETPAADELLSLAQLPTEAPSDQEWDATWQTVARESNLARSSGSSARPRFLPRFSFAWSSAVAAAICLVMVGAWSFFGPTSVTETILLDPDVEIHSIEVFGDDSSFVLEANRDEVDHFAVIWVMEETG